MLIEIAFRKALSRPLIKLGGTIKQVNKLGRTMQLNCVNADYQIDK